MSVRWLALGLVSVGCAERLPGSASRPPPPAYVVVSEGEYASAPLIAAWTGFVEEQPNLDSYRVFGRSEPTLDVQLIDHATELTGLSRSELQERLRTAIAEAQSLDAAVVLIDDGRRLPVSSLARISMRAGPPRCVVDGRTVLILRPTGRIDLVEFNARLRSRGLVAEGLNASAAEAQDCVRLDPAAGPP
ncbi:MAG: hypothetical protein AAFX94_18205 [Myxococcota bacterium]